MNHAAAPRHRRPGRRAHLGARRVDRQHARDVGATDPGAHTPAPGGPLRPPGSRWLARGAWSVLARRPGPGRGRSARRPRPRTRPRRRLVARRHGLHVARRPHARADRPPGLAVHLGGAGTAFALGGAGGDGSSRGHEGHRLDHPRALVHPAAGRGAAGRHGRLRSHDQRHRRRGLCLVLRGDRQHAPPAGAPPGAGAEPRDRRGPGPLDPARARPGHRRAHPERSSRGGRGRGAPRQLGASGRGQRLAARAPPRGGGAP